MERHPPEEFEEALRQCAREPTHSPGAIQPFGCLLGADQATGAVTYASLNAAPQLGHDGDSLLGLNLVDILGQSAIHDLKNALAASPVTGRRRYAGLYDVNGASFDVHGFVSGDTLVAELEPVGEADHPSPDNLRQLVGLNEQIETATFQQPLFESLVRLMRHLSGFDRVMLYKFDRDYNGEVVAEAKRPKLEPFLGLHFPHWDIPPQAREIMRQTPMRLIPDTTATACPVLTTRADLPPLDLTAGHLRAVAPVHLDYMKNMGVQSSMTLSIVVDDRLWGMISFHHQSPKLASPRLREMLSAFLPVFKTKLNALVQHERLALVNRVDAAKEAILQEIDEQSDLQQSFAMLAPILIDVFEADGFASLAGSQSFQHGQVPGQAILDRLLHLGNNHREEVIPIENLAADYPIQAADLNGIAGALVAATTPNRAIAIFRKEARQSLHWAGNPNQTVSETDGVKRLEPRGSYQAYLEEVSGRCLPWSEQDLYLATRLWVIINTAERRALLNTINRQQGLMIDELNHRVRNILSLVRSVSSQARRRYGTLNSYAQAVESRILALAAAHDIGLGVAREAVSITQIVQAELEPYKGPDETRVSISGPDAALRADIAPIFALIVHELATNAAKYGALSGDGRISVTLSETAAGVGFDWIERGGPRVAMPKERGFGSTLIEQAVPHEFGGKATLRFDPAGVSASLVLPSTVLSDYLSAADADRPRLKPIGRPETESAGFSLETVSGTALVVEDNFLIAKEVVDQFFDLGFRDVEVFSNPQDALDYLEEVTPVVASLDVNLGNGDTSLPIAMRLQTLGVPFFFTTGYGENFDMPPIIKDVARLTKPVSTTDLEAALSRVTNMS